MRWLASLPPVLPTIANAAIVLPQLYCYFFNCSVIDTLLLKLLAVVRAGIAFVMLSTITALVVRTLLSSGVAAMFPLLACLQRMRVTDVDSRILNMSYPWLGLPISVSYAFFMLHLCLSFLAATQLCHAVFNSCALALA
jgi:hypothetical protein